MNDEDKFIDEFYDYAEIGTQNLIRRGYILCNELGANPFYKVHNIRVPKNTTRIDQSVKKMRISEKMYLLAHYVINITTHLQKKYPLIKEDDAWDICFTHIQVQGILNKIPNSIINDALNRALTEIKRELKQQQNYIDFALRLAKTARIN